MKLIKSKNINWIFTLICIAVIVGVLGIFYLENIKNGFVYALLLTLLFFISLLRGEVKIFSLKTYYLVGIIGFAMLWAIFNNFQANDSWKSLSADAKVAIHAQPSQAWSESAFSYPLNEHGNSVSATNFDRIFYFSTALTFVKQHPLGYGLVHSSFGHIARESYPYAPLIQSHSGWMDLILGLGVPGVAILLVALSLAIRQASSITGPWNIFGAWSLLSMVLLFLTTEVSQKNFVDTLVWLIVLVAALSLGKPELKKL